MPAHRLSDRCTAVSTRSLMSASRTSCALRMDTNEYRSSQGVHTPLRLAALEIFWKSFCTRQRSDEVPSSRRSPDHQFSRLPAGADHSHPQPT
jgi:hypothetical protein